MKKTLILVVLVCRLGAIGCFVWSGALAMKAYGFKGLESILSSVRKTAAANSNDPFALALKERDAAARIHRESSGPTRNSQFAARNAPDDPYRYVAGGKKAGRADGVIARTIEGSATPHPSVSHNGGGKAQGKGKGVVGAGEQAKGQFEGIEKRLGGGSGVEMALAGTGFGANATLAPVTHTEGEGSVRGDVSTTKVGKMGRVGSRSISRGNMKLRAATGGKEGLRGAVAASNYGVGGGFQTSAGAAAAGFGEGVSGDKLNMGGEAGLGGEAAGGAGGGVAAPNLDPNYIKPDDTAIKEDAKRDTSYDAAHKAISGIIIATSIMGIGLSLVRLSANMTPFTKAAWWAAWAAGLLMIFAALGIAISMATSQSAIAKGIGTSYLVTIGMQLMGWIALAFSAKKMMKAEQFTRLAGGPGGILVFQQGMTAAMEVKNLMEDSSQNPPVGGAK